MNIKEHMKRNDLLQFICKYYSWIALYLLLIAISYLGFNGILSPFIKTNSDEISLDILLSFALVSGLYYLFFSLKAKNNIYKSALLMLYSSDSGLVDKLRTCTPDYYGKNKNIALSLIVEANVSRKFGHYDSGGPSSIAGYSEVLGDVKSVFDNILEYGKRPKIKWLHLYSPLKNLDNLILNKLPGSLINQHPREIYFLRVNLLSRFLSAAISKNVLIIKDHPRYITNPKTGEKEDISEFGREPLVREFYKMILNEFYRDNEKYEHQPVNLNMQDFEYYIKNPTEKSQLRIDR